MASLRQETTGFASRGADIVAGGRMMLRFDADDLPFAAVERAMARARAAIQADLEVRVLSAKSVDAARLMGPFRIDPDLALRGKIRLIEIDGVDLNPCSGTHVANLGLIGTHFHAGRPVSLGSRRTLELRLAPGDGGGR
jgi:Ser-tRNA(Ala) deacylase AlaX